MNQDKDGVNGEATEDQFKASFRLIIADVILTTGTTIAESNTQFDGKNILIDGTTVAIDGPHSFNSVHIVNGGALTHTANTTTQTHKIDLSVFEQVIVDATSRIDVSGKGYLPAHTTGNSTVGASAGAGGGSYGGLGGPPGPGRDGGPGLVYGDYADPADWGAGGAGIGYSGGRGGGQWELFILELHLIHTFDFICHLELPARFLLEVEMEMSISRSLQSL